jgi:hypothetical protein
MDAQDEPLPKLREEKPMQAQEAPAVTQPLKETLGKMTAPATQAPPSALGLAQSAPAERQGVGDEAPLRVQEPVQREKEESVASALHAPEAAIQSAPETRGKLKTEEAKKAALSPAELLLDELSRDEWIAKIKKLRQAGNRVEAEASLKAFKQRYPGYPIEKVLALPHKLHNEQKEAQ